MGEAQFPPVLPSCSWDLVGRSIEGNGREMAGGFAARDAASVADGYLLQKLDRHDADKPEVCCEGRELSKECVSLKIWPLILRFIMGCVDWGSICHARRVSVCYSEHAPASVRRAAAEAGWGRAVARRIASLDRLLHHAHDAAWEPHVFRTAKPKQLRK